MEPSEVENMDSLFHDILQDARLPQAVHAQVFKNLSRFLPATIQSRRRTQYFWKVFRQLADILAVCCLANDPELHVDSSTHLGFRVCI